MGGKKKAYIHKQTCSWKIQTCLSVYDVLVTPVIKMDEKVSKSESKFL